MDYSNLKKTELLKEIKSLKVNLSSLQDSERIFFEIYDSLSDAIVEVDNKGNIHNANGRFKKLFGINDNKLKFFNLRNFKTAEGTDLKKIFNKLLSKNKAIKITLNTDNEITEADISVHQKTKKEYFLILKLTELFNTDEVELALDNPVVYQFINGLDIGMAVINSRMEIIRTNKKMKEYFPKLEDDKIYTCYELYNNPPRTKPCDYCPVLKTFKDGKNYETITETPSCEGTINFRLISIPLKDKKGKVKYVIEMAEDITDKIQTGNLLKEQSRFTEYLTDSIPIPVFYKDTAGKYVNCNTACSEYYGCEKKDIIGKTVFDIHKNENAVTFNKMDLDIIKTGKTKNYEYSTYNRKKKEETDLILTKAPFYDFEGNIAGIIGVITDISDRKRNERALQEHKEYISNLIDTANIMIINLDVKGKIILFNKKAEEITGYKSKEVIGKNYFDTIVPRKKYPNVYERFNAFLSKEGMSIDYMESKILTKKGNEKLVSWRNSEVKRNGELLGILAFGIDITEMKENESVINKFTRVAEQTSDLIFITDTKGRIEYTNPAFTSVTGYTKEEVIGKNPNILKASDEYDAVYEDLWKTITSGKNWYGEFLNKKKNGELFYLYGSVSPIKDDTGNITNYIAISSDISRIKSAYEELKLMKEKVEESDRLRYSLLSNLHSEFRTPLISILGFTEILNNEIKDEWQKEILKDIRKQSKILLRTLSLILKLAQLELNEVKPNIQKINFIPLVEEIINEYQTQAEEKGLKFLRKEISGDIIVQCDPLMLIEIIENLLDNAVKFTDKGYIKTEFEKVKEDEKLYALLNIKYSGKGIHKDKPDLIFSESGSDIEEGIRKKEGAELGLTVSSYMAKLMDGKIAIESTPFKGSEFILYIPLLTDKNLKYYKSRDEEIIRKMKKTDGYKPERKKPQLLLVEDNLSNINIVEIFLNDICSIDSVTSGEEALKLILKKSYDIIVMDINLGQGMNGIIAAKEIFKTKKYGNIPIIAVTGYAMYNDREKLLSEGFTDYLAKPFTKQQLINLILKYVKK
ncbi:MAG: PAS domain S-box protein [Ignavibacteria bacterium]|nr:PAS domain S-box protein [Ignavibacteria bacterium]